MINQYEANLLDKLLGICMMDCVLKWVVRIFFACMALIIVAWSVVQVAIDYEQYQQLKEQRLTTKGSYTGLF